MKNLIYVLLLFSSFSWAQGYVNITAAPTGATGASGVTGNTGPTGPNTVLDNQFLVENASDTTKQFSFDLSGLTTGILNKLGFLSTANTTYNFPAIVDATGIPVIQNGTTNQVFMGRLFQNFGGSNAGFQYSADVANRAQFKAFAWGNNNGVAGMTCEKLRSAVGTTTGSALQVGDIPCKITIQSGSATDGSAPISGSFTNVITQVGATTSPSASDWYWQLATKAGTLTEQMRLTSEGFLQLHGPITQTQQSTPSSNPPSGSNQLYFKSDGNLYSLNSSGTETQIGASGGGLTAGSIPFSNGTTLTQDNSNFFWDSSNIRLGLGTNSPGGLLQMGSSTESINTKIVLGKYDHSNESSLPYIQEKSVINAGVGNDLAFAARSSTGGLVFYTGGTTGEIGTSSNAIREVIDSTGKVGIGTTSPATTLDINGQVTVEGMTQTSAAQSGTVCYNSSSGAITYDATLGCLTSSKRFKTDIQDLDAGLNEVMKLRPVSFKRILNDKDRKNPTMRGHHVGLIAEEVNEIDKRLVGFDHEGRPLGVRYQEMTAVLIKAIQQQQEEIDYLKNRLYDLENR